MSFLFKLRRRIFLLFLGMFICISGMAQVTVQQPVSKTYILAVSACPPWKSIQFKKWAKYKNNPVFLNGIYTCENTVNLMVEALAKRYQVPANQATRLVDQNATYKNIYQAFSTLKKKMTKQDRLIVYMLLHGTPVDFSGQKREMLFLWDRLAPRNFLKAYLNNDTTEVIDLRHAITAIPKKQLLFILDACHSGVALTDFKKGDHMIMVTSAMPNQVANFTADYRFALFSKNFADQLLQADNKDDLGFIFNKAKIATIQQAGPICKQNKSIGMIAPTANCFQVPDAKELNQYELF